MAYPISIYIHILLILLPEDKLQSVDDYDSIISAKIPDLVTYSLAYETIANAMMHGPCGEMNPIVPCMKDDICQKHYPKIFQESIQENHNRYPIYHKRDNDHFVKVRDA